MRYKTFKECAFSSLHIFRKEDLNSRDWNALHSSLIYEYPDHVLIYCDGSVANNRSACGVWSNNFAIKTRLPDNSSIFMCELYAIFVAITYVSTIPGKFLILTDSLSAVEALRVPHHSQNYLVLQIAALISDLPSNKVSIQWVPSHNNILGNERVDALAKDAINLQYITEVPRSVDDAIRLAKLHYKTEMHEICDPCHHNTYLSVSRSNLPFLLLPRKLQTVLTRLHLKVTKITHDHILKREEPKSCNNCERMRVSLSYMVDPKNRIKSSIMHLEQFCKHILSYFSISNRLKK